MAELSTSSSSVSDKHDQSAEGTQQLMTFEDDETIPIPSFLLMASSLQISGVTLADSSSTQAVMPTSAPPQETQLAIPPLHFQQTVVDPWTATQNQRQSIDLGAALIPYPSQSAISTPRTPREYSEVVQQESKSNKRMEPPSPTPTTEFRPPKELRVGDNPTARLLDMEDGEAVEEDVQEDRASMEDQWYDWVGEQIDYLCQQQKVSELDRQLAEGRLERVEQQLI